MNNIIKSNDETEPQDFSDFILLIYKKKLIVFSAMVISSVLALGLALSLSDVYRSETILSTRSLDQSQNQFSEAARFIGINLTNSNSSNITKEAISKIKTLSFFESQILPNIKLQDLMAFKSWDKISNSVIYDSKIFDDQTQQWKSKNNSGTFYEPTIQESFSEFSSRLRVRRDNDGGFYIISYDHESPYIAKSWLELVVSEVNELFRDLKKNQSIAAIEFLNAQMSQTTYKEIKQGLSELIQNEIKELSLVEANADYVFTFIDPPYVPEKKN